MAKYTSQELSSNLLDAGFSHNSEMRWVYFMKGSENDGWQLVCREDNSVNEATIVMPAYDILNDLCVKHVDKLFDTNMIEWSVDGEDVLMFEHRKVLLLIAMNLQQGKKKQAEEIFWDNCILNNKHG